MEASVILKDKVILVVHDEPDALDTVADILVACLITKAKDFETTRQYLMAYSYDIVVLDIMGVNGCIWYTNHF
jgi:DNA-binding response OmpR family regulator